MPTPSDMENTEEVDGSDNAQDIKRSMCSKVLQTGFVFWSIVIVGISDSLLGPSLLDLQSLLHSDLDSITYIVLVAGLGDFVGSLLAGFIARVCHIHFRLAVAVLIGAVSIATSVTVPNYYFVLAMFAVQGVLRGIVFCFSLEACNRIWTKSKGIALQTISLGPAVGQMLSPLVVKPFLCVPRTLNPEHLNSNETLLRNTSTNHAINYVVNVTYDERYTNITNTSSSGAHALHCLPEDVQLSYAYTILGILGVPASVAFFIYWWKEKNKVDKMNKSKTKLSMDTKSDHRFKTFFVIVFLSFYFPLLGSVISYSTYLTEFSVRGPLRLGKPVGATLTSVFWACCVSGRFVSILLLKIVNIERLLIANMFGLLIFSTLLVSCIVHAEAVLWTCTCAIGLFIGPFSGGGYSWITSKMALSSRVISLSGASLALGGMLVPFASGQIFDNMGPMAFIYFSYSLYVLISVLFIFLVVFARKLKPLTVMETQEKYILAT